MLGTKLIVYNFVVWLATSSKLLIRAERGSNGTQIGLNETKGLRIFPGIRFSRANDEIVVQVKMNDLLQEIEVQNSGRSHKRRKNPLQRLGFMMMMTPFVMQMLSLPGAIASIKMSLLKSIMVAQLAIAIMLYNFFRSVHNREEVVVYEPHHHDHYYDNHHHPPDNEDEWFGR